MGLYQCRGQIIATSSDGKDYCIIIKAITQFECKKNRLNKYVMSPVKFPGGTSFDATVFNIFMEVEAPSNIKPPFYQLTDASKIFALPADHPILVPKKLRGRFDDFDTDPQYEWTFVIGEVEASDKPRFYDYELKYIQLGPQGGDE